MKTLDRYLIRELIVPFLVGGLSVTLLFQINTYMAFAKDMNLTNVPRDAVLQVILYKTPYYLSLTLPTAVSLGASLAMSRLARESELTAFRSAGASIRRTLWPFALFGIVVGAGNWWITNKIQPKADALAMKRSMQIGLTASGLMTSSNVPLKFNNQYAMFLGSIESHSGNHLAARDVLLVDYRDHNEWRAITASRTTYEGGIWTFSDAYLRVFQGEDLVQARPYGSFKQAFRISPTDVLSSFEPENDTPERLREKIDSLKKIGGNAKKYEIQLQQMSALPAACVVMSFVSPIFAILFARSGGFAGVLLSSLLVVAYYNVYVVCGEILGKLPNFPAFWAAWAPIALFSVAGLIAIKRLE